MQPSSNHQTTVAIAVGYGPVMPAPHSGSGHLNLSARLNALAAGTLYASGAVGAVIVTGGRTGGEERPSEAELMGALLRRRFGVPAADLWLETEARNTALNLVLVANLLDRAQRRFESFLYVGMRSHLPRILELARLIGLPGDGVSAEDVVGERSAHHACFVERMLARHNGSYTQLLRNEELCVRALHEMPEYWLPPVARLEDDDRLRRVLTVPRLQPFLAQHNVDLQRWTPEQLRAWLRTIPRRWPFPREEEVSLS